jgi:hypothetical protein
MKYLLVLIVVMIGVLLLKKQWGSKQALPRSKSAKRAVPEDPVTLRETEPMMRCTHCGVFHPKSASIVRNGQHYCSHEHAEQQQR